MIATSASLPFWSCIDTDTQLPAYRAGTLDVEAGEAFFNHVLGCERCRSHYWADYFEEASAMVDAMLVVLAPDDDHLQAATWSGQTVLTLDAWTRPTGMEPEANTEDFGAPIHPPPQLQRTSGPRLRRVGTVLPRVPRRELLRGYVVYLGEGLPRPDRTPSTSARLLVMADGSGELVSIEAIGPGVVVDSVQLEHGQRRVLSGSQLVQVGADTYLVQRPDGDQRWMGAALLRHPGEEVSLESGCLRVGRAEGSELRLSDRLERSNLLWNYTALEKISSVDRVALEQLTLDSLDVSRHHATLTLGTGQLEVRAESSHPCFVVNETARALTRDTPAAQVGAGSLLRLGQQVYELVLS